MRVVGGTLALVIAALALWPKAADNGSGRFFANESYNFEAVRILNDIAAAGGDAGEVLSVMVNVRSGDEDSWYQTWTAAGDRALALAQRTQDAQARGNSLLRAHTYYRSAEFFLPPQDPRRASSFKSNVAAFYAGLDTLKVSYERLVVPYGAHHLNSLYFPGPAGAESRPLLVVVGGYDSTLEELYLSVGAAALQHGYAALLYEGPGQGSVLRDQALHMQPDWEKPNRAALDQFLGTHARPRKIVLLGESLGGYLAPRAAAFDPRIDGVVAFDAWYDGYAVASRQAPSFALWMHTHGYDKQLNSIAEKTRDPGARWAIQNGEWVLGVNGAMTVMESFKAYSLAPVADKITQDVLLLAGADDHFVPVAQVEQERQALVSARSVTTVVYDRSSGGSLHCQIGAPTLWQATLFDWMAAKFGG